MESALWVADIFRLSQTSRNGSWKQETIFVGGEGIFRHLSCNNRSTRCTDQYPERINLSRCARLFATGAEMRVSIAARLHILWLNE
jgi:hypothetical protein